MNAHVSAITLGVADVDRAKRFYTDLGWTVAQDYGQFVSFASDEGGTGLSLYAVDALAEDAGVKSDGSGFHGMTLSYFATDQADVDAVLAAATAAGGTIAKPAAGAEWGGYSGYFADPDGYLWKVVAS